MFFLRVSVLVIVVLLYGQPAHGSTDYFTDEQLIGWSEDGLTWVTQRIQREDGQIERGGYKVYKKNREVAKYERRQLDSLRKRFPYVKLAADWRENFKKRFTARSSHRKYHEEAGPCLQRWRLVEKTTGQIHYLHKAEWFCSAFYGGYEHASKRYVLLKYMDGMTSDDNDGYCCSFDKVYRWVQLGADLRHVPPAAGDWKVWPVKFCGEYVEREATEVSCGSQSVSDLRPLAKLKKLRRLNISDTNVRNIRPLARFTHLEELSLDGTKVRNFGPLAKLTKLTKLRLYGTQIRRLDVLAKLKSLQELDLTGTKVTNLEALGELTGLKRLYVRKTAVSYDQLQKLQKALPGLEIDALKTQP